MATLDRSQNAIVVRIVYDGPSAAGKTTSLLALGRSLGRQVFTPKTAGERTLYFDWLDYTGGRFEDFQIQCQVVTVPGQRMLSQRREVLLRQADAIVYVTQVTAKNLTETIEAIRAVSRPAEADDVALGVVLQANKQDVPESLGHGQLREAFTREGLSVGIVESIAVEGTGIREAFVLAIRQSLDRIKLLRERGLLTEGPASIQGADQMLSFMEQHESEQLRSTAATPIAAPELAQIIKNAAADDADDAGTANATVHEESAATLPDASVATGSLWPPIDGRNVLLDAHRKPLAYLVRNASGWLAESADGWQFQSPNGARYASASEARATLVSWARNLIVHRDFLTQPRVLAVAQDAQGGHRLWQVFKKHPSLRDRLAEHLDVVDSAQIAKLLLETATLLLDAQDDVRATTAPIKLTLDNVGASGGRPRFVGAFPATTTAPPADPLAILAGFDRILSDWSASAASIVEALVQLSARRGTDRDRAIAARLASMVPARR